MDKTIHFEKKGPVGRLVLNHGNSNAMDICFFIRLKDLILNTIPESRIKALLIYSSSRHFSSGADLKNLLTMVSQKVHCDHEGTIVSHPDFLLENIQIFKHLLDYKFPVISVIKGICIGSGLELALSSHYRICYEGAVLGLPETSFSLMPGCGGIGRLLEICGRAKTLELVLDGGTFSAQKAYEYKVVDQIIPKRLPISRVLDEISRSEMTFNNSGDTFKFLD